MKMVANNAVEFLSFCASEKEMCSVPAAYGHSLWLLVHRGIRQLSVLDLQA